METGIIIDDIKQYELFIKQLNENETKIDFCRIIHKNPVKYIYYGQEFCQYRLPSLEEIKYVVKYCTDNGLEFVLVTPPLTDYGIRICRKYIEYFISIEMKCDIVINDVGLLNYINKIDYKGNIIFGRILEKSIHETRLTDLEEQQYYSPKGYEYIKSLALQSKNYEALFEKERVSRIEYDGRKTIDRGLGLKVDYIYPTEYLTTGRMCLFRVASQKPEDKFLLNDNCQKLCKNNYEILSKMTSYYKIDSSKRRIREMRVLRKGNTLFHIHSTLSIEESVERLIIDLVSIYDTIFFKSEISK